LRLHIVSTFWRRFAAPTKQPARLRPPLRGVATGSLISVTL